jgi:hypothetical protein
MGRLNKFRVYLAGPIDRAEDHGVGWREDISPFLRSIGVQIFNPCNKPINIGLENIEKREYRQKLKQEQKYDELSKEIKLLRIIDLAMVDKSDFIIAYIDTDIHLTGTYEEIFWANRLKRPILICCKRGKVDIPDWLFGVLPHQFFFDTWTDLKQYLLYVNDLNNEPKHYKRWTFFDYNKL